MRRADSVWLVWLVWLLALAVMSSAQQFPDPRYDKRDEVALPVRGASHGWGSRYGRSGGHAEVSLRNDRFFLGSRYGKRDELPPSAGTGEAGEDGALTCLYTGVTNLYRCFDRKDNASEDFPPPRN